MLLVGLCMVLAIHSQSIVMEAAIEDILEDIYNQLSEDDEILQEDVQEQLMNIAANPINLNHTNADELAELMFLSDEKIDAIMATQLSEEMFRKACKNVIENNSTFEETGAKLDDAIEKLGEN